MEKYFYNLGDLLAEVTRKYSKRPALRYADEQHSFNELAEWTDRLVKLLISMKLHSGDAIAIGNNKRPLSYALMLAAIRLGIPYLNIDVESPIERNSRILKVSRAKILFYDDSNYSSEMSDLAAACGTTALLLQTSELPSVAEADREIQRQRMLKVDGSTIAYVMFTSGSTGTPKGVAVTHQNVLHFIEWGRERFGVTDQDNFANLSPMYFDNSVFDFYVGLFSGASLSPVDRSLMTTPYEMIKHLTKMQVTIWFSVPSLLIYMMTMKAMTTEALPKLRRIVFGGEGYPKVELKKLFDLFSKQATLVNVYGPTECTCICSAYNIGDEDFREMTGLPTLGTLNQNFDYLILDESEKESDTGELCLIGPNVAAGYFNELELSARSFITLTDARRFMKRMYRTGDLVRESEGRLYFVGRKDNQIKHMGYRIELEEIEHALVKLPQINQAAVIYQRTNAAYGKLIGFVATSADLDEKNLLVALAKVVPEYMIPARILIKKELPKNPNGKVDRHQLAALVAK